MAISSVLASFQFGAEIAPPLAQIATANTNVAAQFALDRARYSSSPPALSVLPADLSELCGIWEDRLVSTGLNSPARHGRDCGSMCPLNRRQ
jgi:hypothetical protein